MSEPKPVVLFVDDQMALLEQFTQILEWDGYDVLAASRANDVLDLIDKTDRIDVAVLDLQLPIEGSDRIPPKLVGDGDELGLLLASRLREKFPHTPILFWSGTADEATRAKTVRVPNSHTYAKNVPPQKIQNCIRELVTSPRRRPKRKAFIVHGHAVDVLEELKGWLRQAFDDVEPIVLREMPSGGATLIDKFETHALGAELVFVLLTPDDTVQSSRRDQESRRARQNVVFEMGYFFGRFGRRTGRVILLSCGSVELPSDIHGMVPIDVSEGVARVGESIRREIGWRD